MTSHPNFESTEGDQLGSDWECSVGSWTEPEEDIMVDWLKQLDDEITNPFGTDLRYVAFRKNSDDERERIFSSMPPVATIDASDIVDESGAAIFGMELERLPFQLPDHDARDQLPYAAMYDTSAASSKVVMVNDNKDATRNHDSTVAVPPTYSISGPLSSGRNTLQAVDESSSLQKSPEMAAWLKSNDKAGFIGQSVLSTTSTNTEEKNDVVYFGKIKHKGTKLWREIVQEYSVKRTVYPTWSESIMTEVKERLEQRGVHQFMTHETSDNTGPSTDRCWRVATSEEIIEKTKQRFKDSRKVQTKSNASRPRGRPPKSRVEDHNTRPPILIREPCYTITERTVCVGWDVHPGTIKWRDVLKELSLNTTLFPEWKDNISFLVTSKLAEENYTPFLVARDSNGRPCGPNANGLWVLATEDEIVELNKQEFCVQRSRLVRNSRDSV